MDAKDWVAIYGAVVATAIAVWTLYRGYLERSKRVEVAVLHGRMQMPNEAGPPSEPRWLISVSNAGERSVLLSEIGFTFRNRRSSIIPGIIGSMKKLEPGETVNYAFSRGPQVSEVKKVWVEDYTRKRFVAGPVMEVEGPGKMLRPEDLVPR